MHIREITSQSQDRLFHRHLQLWSMLAISGPNRSSHHVLTDPLLTIPVWLCVKPRYTLATVSFDNEAGWSQPFGVPL
jgi:hypothetical protein